MKTYNGKLIEVITNKTYNFDMEGDNNETMSVEFIISKDNTEFQILKIECYIPAVDKWLELDNQTVMDDATKLVNKYLFEI